MNLILKILKNIPLFQTLTEEENQSIIDHITLQYFPAHYVLFEKGAAATGMYIVKSGVLRIYNGSDELASLGEGDFFGETALIDDQPRNASAETLSDCEIFVLNKADFAELIQKSPVISHKVEEVYLKRKPNH